MIDKIMSIEFSYRKKTHYALVREKILDQRNAYCVTIMNGELERLWYGHHIFFVEEQNFARSQRTIADNEVAELRDCIATALWQHLSEKPLNNHRKYEELFE